MLQGERVCGLSVQLTRVAAYQNQTYNMQVRVGCIFVLEICLPRTPARETRNIDAMVNYLHTPITLWLKKLSLCVV